MQFRVFPPPTELGAWVAFGVHVAFDSVDAAPMPCHFPALVEGGLTVVTEGAFLAPGPSGVLTALPTAFVSSANPLPSTLWRTPRLQCVGLRLHAAATLGLLRDSPAHLPHRLVDADEVFGSDWAHLVERIHAARHPARALDLLFAFAAQRLCADLHLQRLQRACRLQAAAMRGGDAHAGAGLGRRQFERVFAGQFGLRPKLFQRVARLEGLLRDALGADATGADLALRHGYYDQSHMAGELRALAGAPLRTLVGAVRGGDPAHWALAIGTSR